MNMTIHGMEIGFKKFFLSSYLFRSIRVEVVISKSARSNISGRKVLRHFFLSKNRKVVHGKKLKKTKSMFERWDDTVIHLLFQQDVFNMTKKKMNSSKTKCMTFLLKNASLNWNRTNETKWLGTAYIQTISTLYTKSNTWIYDFVYFVQANDINERQHVFAIDCTFHRSEEAILLGITLILVMEVVVLLLLLFGCLAAQMQINCFLLVFISAGCDGHKSNEKKEHSCDACVDGK